MAHQHAGYGSVPAPGESQLSQGYGAQDFGASNHNPLSSPLSQTMNTTGAYDDYDDSTQRGNSVVDGSSVDGSAAAYRGAGTASTSATTTLPSRNNTLKKRSSRSSVRRVSSLRRSSSKRSLKAGAIGGFGGVDSNPEYNSFSHTPVPTSGAPTEILANRFQSWRQLLKSLITYFREIQASYDARQKATLKVQNTVANIVHPSVFMSQHGLGDATRILDEFHRKTVAEANKSRDIEADVIGALTGLRSDLGQKIKEIKSLSGDFKNSVEKEKDSTRKAVEQYQDALARADHQDSGAMGKGDPFVVRLSVDRMIERQIDEENYLHRAYLNLESSGRELESIVVGEIQKAFNALAGILKREGDDAYNTVDLLRSGPISIAKDAEWTQFVTKDEHFVDPSMPLRRVEDIHYPGKDNPAAAEVRAGMLERKSKYLKSYTPGWYVLSATHLHEFKSADKIFSQPPVMSLYLPDQRLGSRSQEDSSSHKFMLKGKQSGGMHKGHNWVFRAESYDMMAAWYEDIKILTESTSEQRSDFVRKHARSVSGADRPGTVSSEGLEEDEADAVPYSADAAALSAQNLAINDKPVRPQPGGRFPSDLRVPQNRNVAGAARSVSSDSDQDDTTALAATAVPAAAALAVPNNARHDYYGGQDPYRLTGVNTRPPENPNIAATAAPAAMYSQDPHYPTSYAQPAPMYPHQQPTFLAADHHTAAPEPVSPIDDWVAPAAVAGVGAAGLGAAAYEHERGRQNDRQRPAELDAGHFSSTAQPASFDHQFGALEPEAAGAPIVPASIAGAIHPSTAAAATSGAESSIAAAAPAISAPVGAAPAISSGVHIEGDGAADEGGLVALKGNERSGAHETGSLFPTVIRHESSMSVSALHVPGEFPKRG